MEIKDINIGDTVIYQNNNYHLQGCPPKINSLIIGDGTRVIGFTPEEFKRYCRIIKQK